MIQIEQSIIIQSVFVYYVTKEIENNNKYIIKITNIISNIV